MLKDFPMNGFYQMIYYQFSLKEEKVNIDEIKHVMQSLMKKPTMCQWVVATDSSSIPIFEGRKLAYQRFSNLSKVT